MRNKNEKMTYFVLWGFLCLVLIILSIFKNSEITPKKEDSYSNLSSNIESENSLEEVSQNETSEIVVNKDGSMIGIWISYISFDENEENFKANFDSLVAEAKTVGATDLFVHVRAFSDALYDSEYYPWSHLITGTQGKEPAFDPLAYMIDATHNENMKFHAWINPLRVKLPSTPETLSSDNPYSLYKDECPHYFIETESVVTINPAYKEMRTLVADGVREIVEKYNVDGIHFDDYFYPADIDNEDSASYEIYCENNENPLSLSDWRAANINTMIAQVYRAVKDTNEEVVFGISPQANLENNEKLGADVYAWCASTGYVDYICPQIYFSYDNEYLGFTDSLNQWLAIPKYDGLEMYVGLALYKAGTDSDGGTWDEDNILKRQYEQVLTADLDGVILFDIRYVNHERTEKEIENFISAIKN